MPRVRIEPRYWDEILEDPSDATLRHFLLEADQQGHWGDALVRYDDGPLSREMIILSDLQLGYYFQYISDDGRYLSVGDPSRLDEVVCPDDWYASAGLFVSPDKAWLILVEFCKSGRRADAVEWITPADMPADGNW